MIDITAINSVLDALAPLSAWLLTYLMHSTVLLGAGLGIAWMLRRRVDEALHEFILRMGLFSGVITTTAAMFLPSIGLTPQFLLTAEEPVKHEISLGQSGAEEPGVPFDPVIVEEALRNTIGQFNDNWSGEASVESPPASGDASAPPPTDGASGRMPLAAKRHVQWLPVVTVAGALYALILIIISYRRFLRRVRGRTTVTDPELCEQVEQMRCAFGVRRVVRLTMSDSIIVPLAFGVLRPEICLPKRAIGELCADRVRAVLAHEMAHVARRDPLWRAACRLFRSALFFQPLNHVAARRLDVISEFECDRLAVACTGERITFARCLTEVAGWLMHGRSMHAPVRVAAMASGMAQRSSNIRRRIERVLENRPESTPSRARLRRHVIIGAAALGAAIISISPRVIAGSTERHTGADAADARTLAGDDLTPGAQSEQTLEASVELLRAEIAALEREITELSHKLLSLDEIDAATAEGVIELYERLGALRAAESRLITLDTQATPISTEVSQ